MGRPRLGSKHRTKQWEGALPTNSRDPTQHSTLPNPRCPHASATPAPARCEEHPCRSTWPKLCKFPNCSKTTLEGVVSTEITLMDRLGVPGYISFLSCPGGMSISAGATCQGLMRGWAERGAQHIKAGTPVHSLKSRISIEMMPLLCSEAQLHLSLQLKASSWEFLKCSALFSQ